MHIITSVAHGPEASFLIGATSQIGDILTA